MAAVAHTVPVVIANLGNTRDAPFFPLLFPEEGLQTGAAGSRPPWAGRGERPLKEAPSLGGGEAEQGPCVLAQIVPQPRTGRRRGRFQVLLSVFPGPSVQGLGPSGRLSSPAQPGLQLDIQVRSRDQVPSGRELRTSEQEQSRTGPQGHCPAGMGPVQDTMPHRRLDVPLPLPGARATLCPPGSGAAWTWRLRVLVRTWSREQGGCGGRCWPVSTGGWPGLAPPRRKSLNISKVTVTRDTCEPVSPSLMWGWG